MTKLSHLNVAGEAEMVDISTKSVTQRSAVAEATVRMDPATLMLVSDGELPKGDVLAVARIAGIQAAKRTSELIPLCHPLPLTKVAIQFELVESGAIRVQASASVTGQTGVEMEALTAASVAALTIYDMCKSVQKNIRIDDLHLLSKLGGKSGDWQAE